MGRSFSFDLPNMADFAIMHNLKSLGFFVNKTLDWDEYVNNPLTKANRSLAVLRLAKNLLPIKVNLCLYQTFIKS